MQTTSHSHSHVMAAPKFNETTGKMTQLCRKIVHVNFRWSIKEKATIFRQFFSIFWDKILVCTSSPKKPNPRYRRLFPSKNISSPPSPAALEYSCGGGQELPVTTSSSRGYESDSDLVSLKITMLGDPQIGKTSFLVKYVGDEQEKRSLQMKGVNVMNKSIKIQGATIALRIWDVGGDSSSFDQVPIACRDAVAILFMFDLTSRRTLNSIIGWYNEARKWNQTAVPIVIGTKFDDFIQLPPDIQWTVVTQARTCAKGMKAALFFSSAKHNINVNKIFKFVMAKLFNMPWSLHRNLTLGEPIIDF